MNWCLSFWTDPYQMDHRSRRHLVKALISRRKALISHRKVERCAVNTPRWAAYGRALASYQRHRSHIACCQGTRLSAGLGPYWAVLEWQASTTVGSTNTAGMPDGQRSYIHPSTVSSIAVARSLGRRVVLTPPPLHKQRRPCPGPIEWLKVGP